MTQQYRFTNGPAPSGVDIAIGITQEFVGETRKAHGSDSKAIEDVAAASGVSRTIIRSLWQPSRRPKSIDFDVFERLRGAWLRHLRRQRQRIDNDIRRIEALGGDPHLVDELCAQAQDLVDRVEALARRPQR